MKISPEKIDDLSPERRKAVMERSMDDISSIFEDVRGIVDDIKSRGNAVTLEHYKKHKSDITTSDLEATREEIQEAYSIVGTEVVECLKTAAANITKFHKAQLEREMWSIEVSEGILAGRITRAMDIVGCYIPGHFSRSDYKGHGYRGMLYPWGHSRISEFRPYDCAPC